MPRNKELIAAVKAITNTGLFFCKHCWNYCQLKDAKEVPKKGKICQNCIAKIAKAKIRIKASGD